MERTQFLKRPGRIGLMADSHGNLESIKKGIALLRKSAIHQLIHLGDIYDSLENDNLYDIYAAITDHNILSVKGNNDFQIQNLLNNGHLFDISNNAKKEIGSLLMHMPMRIEEDAICFTHSLPFDSIRSFYEPVDNGTTDRAIQVFAETKYQVLFCGHSHSSILFRYCSGRVTRETIMPNKINKFNASERYIVIVGSSDRGEFGIFDKDRMTYQRVSIDL